MQRLAAGAALVSARPRAAGFAAALLAAAAAAAQEASWTVPDFPDPVRFSSLPLEPVEAAVPPAGAVLLRFGAGYFNVWQRSWHTATIHHEFHLDGLPLQEWEVRTLAERHPRDQFYHIDLEGTRSELAVTVGLGRGWALSARVPWIEVGEPHWDGIAESFHRALGLENMRRDTFPRGQSSVVIRGRRDMLVRLDGLAGGGLGDTALALSGPAGAFLGGEQRWVAAVEAPTGARDTLRGSGGWDAGLRAFSRWGDDRRGAALGAGYTWLDPAGSFMGIRRDDTWHFLGEGHVPIGAGYVARLAARLDASPLRSFTDSPIGETSFYWMLGVRGPLAGGVWWSFDGGENYGSQAEVPDFSFHLQFGTRIGH